MITHDLKESFQLGTRLLVFDKRRNDPHEPERYGATVTYDIPLNRKKHSMPLASLTAALAGP
jgi:NitT/TauT family transport system ATP-binding protein